MQDLCLCHSLVGGGGVVVTGHVRHSESKLVEVFILAVWLVCDDRPICQSFGNILLINSYSYLVW